MEPDDVETQFKIALAPYGKPLVICLVGSHGYNLALPDSDYDYRGVFHPKAEYLLGLRRVEQVKVKEDDWVCQELRHFVHIVLQQNPTILELLFIENPVFETRMWWELVPQFKTLITRDAFKPYNAYFMSQVKKAQNKQFIGKRIGMIEKYGYDPKFMSHTVRLGHQCCVLMETGNIPVYIDGEYRDLIMKIKTGEMPRTEVMAVCDELNYNMHYQYKHSQLPTKQPWEKFEKEFFIPLMKDLAMYC